MNLSLNAADCAFESVRKFSNQMAEFFSGNELEISLQLHDLSSNAFAVERSEEIYSSSIYLLPAAIVILLSTDVRTQHSQRSERT